jgi:hypothetical protein
MPINSTQHKKWQGKDSPDGQESFAGKKKVFGPLRDEVNEAKL